MYSNQIGCFSVVAAQTWFLLLLTSLKLALLYLLLAVKQCVIPRQLVASIVACAFLCIFPILSEGDSVLCSWNLNFLFSTFDMWVVLHCLYLCVYLRFYFFSCTLYILTLTYFAWNYTCISDLKLTDMLQRHQLTRMRTWLKGIKVSKVSVGNGTHCKDS